jgi:multicomponent Na+:H+ antiporter subunit E
MSKTSLFTNVMSFISLMIFWVVMSGFIDVIHLSMGVVTVVGVLVFNSKLKNHQFFEDDMSDLSELRFGMAFYYFFWMIWQIIIAGFHVLWVITSPKMPIQTTVLTFRANLPSAHAKMILGNSITLTPGTLTMDIEGDLFTVHALTAKSYEGIINDEMPKMVLKLFSKEDRPVVSDINIITENA